MDISFEAIANRGAFLLVLNGGSTPGRLFELVATEELGKIEWQKTQVCWGDERCVAPDNPESNYEQARERFLSRVAIPAANIHRIKGELPPAEAAKDYTVVLKHFASPPLGWPV